VVRASHKGERTAIDWCTFDGKKNHPRYKQKKLLKIVNTLVEEL
jgi:hypothetical protein